MKQNTNKVNSCYLDPNMRKVVIMKVRSMGASTASSQAMQQWAHRMLHQVEGYDLLDEVHLDNFGELQQVFESDWAGWLTGLSRAKKRTQHREGAYLSVKSPALKNRTLIYIDTEGNKSFLTKAKYDPVSETYPIANTYYTVSYRDIMESVTPKEQENLIYFLDHA